MRCVGLTAAATGCSFGDDRQAAVRCEAGDFNVRGVSWNGATGSLVGRLTLSRKTGDDCFLDPMVRARILWGDGQLALPVTLVDRLSGDGSARPARPDADRVAIGLQWRNWCGRGTFGRKGLDLFGWPCRSRTAASSPSR